MTQNETLAERSFILWVSILPSSVTGPGTPGKACVKCGEAVVGRNDPPLHGQKAQGEISDGVEQLQKMSGAIHMASVNTFFVDGPILACLFVPSYVQSISIRFAGMRFSLAEPCSVALQGTDGLEGSLM